MDLTRLYSEHLDRLDQSLTDSLERAEASGLGLEGVVFHAGRGKVYHADDRAVVFYPNAHYRRWAPPQDGAEHCVLARPGQRPKVVRVRPQDYWFDTSAPPAAPWQDAVDFVEVASFDQVAAELGDLGGMAYAGDSTEAAAQLGIPRQRVEPAELMAPLDWHRAIKTDYEIALTRVACERAAGGHRRAKEVFLGGGTERDVHRAYLEGAGHLEFEVPFETIVAFDDKASILHYQHKRGAEAAPGRVLLMDAGGAHCGYASDVTRTTAREDVDPRFRGLIEAVDALERSLVAMVAPGRSYIDIHLACHRGIAEILVDTGLFAGSVAEALDWGITRVFMPHGVGHQLGLQVHDVGGHQAAPEGGLVSPPDGHVLRNTRTLEPGHLVTIEPGFYFIPMLLEPLRQGSHGSQLAWDAIDALTSYGGIRIEDDVLCTEDGYEDLTRELVGP